MANFTVIGVHHFDPKGPERLRAVLDDIKGQEAQWGNAVVALEFVEAADQLLPSIRQQFHIMMGEFPSGQEALAVFKNVPLYEVEITKQKMPRSEIWWIEPEKADASSYAQSYSKIIHEIWSVAPRRDPDSLSLRAWESADHLVHDVGPIRPERETQIMDQLSRRLGQYSNNHPEAVIVIIGDSYKNHVGTMAKEMGFEIRVESTRPQ